MSSTGRDTDGWEWIADWDDVIYGSPPLRTIRTWRTWVVVVWFSSHTWQLDMSVRPSIRLSIAIFIHCLLERSTLIKTKPNSPISAQFLISYLISKLIAFGVKSQLTNHFASSNLLDPHQSAYCKADQLFSGILGQTVWPFGVMVITRIDQRS